MRRPRSFVARPQLAARSNRWFLVAQTRMNVAMGLIALLGGLAVALVPFRVWVPRTFAPTGGYNSDCGVPARTSFRKLEPVWKAYSHGYMAEPDYPPSSRADPRCQTPARRRLLGGSAVALIDDVTKLG